MSPKLTQWAIRHGVSHAALAELHAMFTAPVTDPQRIVSGLSEAAVSNRVVLEASRKGARLWRNNVGAYVDQSGREVRYGLCNLSKQMNAEIKSPDLVGIKPVLITPDMVGCTIGQFVAREIKAADWVWCGDAHETAQLTFLNLAAALGADACFAVSEGTL